MISISTSFFRFDYFHVLFFSPMCQVRGPSTFHPLNICELYPNDDF
jgi:hypothetical protein